MVSKGDCGNTVYVAVPCPRGRITVSDSDDTTLNALCISDMLLGRQKERSPRIEGHSPRED